MTVLNKLYRNVRGVAAKDWDITISNLAMVILDNDLAVRLAASFVGSSLELDATKPRLRSLTATFLTLKPTLSLGRPSAKDSW